MVYLKFSYVVVHDGQQKSFKPCGELVVLKPYAELVIVCVDGN